MDVIQRVIGGCFILDLHSKIFDRNHINDLKNKVEELVVQDVEQIYINFEEIDNINYVGLGVLLAIQKIVIIHNVNIRLFNVKPNVLKVLEQTHIHKVLDICPSEELYYLESQENALIA